MAYTKAPTGLTISRNGNTITCSWKIADSNYSDGQQFCYQLSNFKSNQYTYLNVENNATSISFNINPDNYYPVTKTKLTWIKFWVRGNRNDESDNPGWSSWSEKTVNLYVPNVPSLVTSGEYSTASNQTTFTWNTEVDDSSLRLFYNTEVQTILVKNSDVTDGSKLAWNSNTYGWSTFSSSRNSSTTKIEDTDIIASGPCTRWYRVRARGPAGDSAWRYAKHVYATPNRPVIKSVEIKDTASGGLRVFPRWSINQPASRPIDTTIVEYAIAVPDENFTCPPIDSWNTGDSSKDTSGYDKATFVVPLKPALDHALYIRVTAKHDNRETNSTPYMAYFRGIAPPTNLRIGTMDETTRRMSVHVENESEIPDSRVAIICEQRRDRNENWSYNISSYLGILEHGVTDATIQIPTYGDETLLGIGAMTFVGTSEIYVSPDEVVSYIIWYSTHGIDLISEKIWVKKEEFPSSPGNLIAETTNIEGTIRLLWDLTWYEANATELSWSDHKDAWESTDEPSTYNVTNIYASQWNISGLATGKTWYFRARYMKIVNDTETYGPYSNIVDLDLASAPAVPSLTLSESVISATGEVIATWAYVSADGTSQGLAKICEATINDGVITYGRTIAQTETSQQITINALDAGWIAGNTYNLCLQVVSSSGKASESWSEPVPISVADPLEISIESTSLVTVDDTLVLREMPFAINVTGAGEGGLTSIIIERAESYYLIRPDEDEYGGQEGETIAIYTQDGENEIAISNDILNGFLDDGAKYRLIATIQDGLGQTSTTSLDFVVHWSHQAILPDAEIEVDTDQCLVYIKPIAEAPEGDVCDIYRLSIDKPELIIQNGIFGKTYIDPYPTLGSHGGYRVVYKTANGDFITNDDKLAWIDILTNIDLFALIIDFDGQQVVLPYNLSISNNWDKDFQETKYLGGSVQGDWASAVSKTASISTSVLVEQDSETLELMRRLAEYSGICHVRTPEGTSYSANVNISESREEKWISKVSQFSLDITRVDSEGYDGMEFDEDIN